MRHTVDERRAEFHHALDEFTNIVGQLQKRIDDDIADFIDNTIDLDNLILFLKALPYPCSFIRVSTSMLFLTHLTRVNEVHSTIVRKLEKFMSDFVYCDDYDSEEYRSFASGVAAQFDLLKQAKDEARNSTCDMLYTPIDPQSYQRILYYVVMQIVHLSLWTPVAYQKYRTYFPKS